MLIAQFLNGSPEVVYIDRLMRSIRVVTLIVVDGDGCASRVFGTAKGNSKIKEAAFRRDVIDSSDREASAGCSLSVKSAVHDLPAAIDYMRQKRIRRMPVINFNGEAVGAIGLDDVKNLLIDAIDVRRDRYRSDPTDAEFYSSKSIKGVTRYEIGLTVENGR